MLLSALLSAALLFPAISADFTYQLDTHTLTLVGDIVASDYSTLITALETYPEMKYIKMTSPGGDFNAGINMGIVLKDFNIGTVASEYCASACAYMWLAGNPKMHNLDIPTEIAIHMPGTYNSKTQKYENTVDPLDYLDVGYYIGYTVGDFRVAKAITDTPYNDVLHINNEVAEMLGLTVIPWVERTMSLGR